MIGNVIAPFEGVYVSPSPDDYFDPVTHIATEANFIKFLQTGIYTEDVIGYKVQLSNSVEYNDGLWVIADVGHHANQPNTYDLISQDCFYKRSFGSSNIWRNSDVRTWLNNTFYNGFSENFKSHMNNITYVSSGGTYNDDKVILPSYTELKGGTSSYAATEGTAYPIFTDNNSRKKYQTGTTSYGGYWTRSYYASSSTSGNVWIVDTYGKTTRTYYTSVGYLAPLLRVS